VRKATLPTAGFQAEPKASLQRRDHAASGSTMQLAARIAPAGRGCGKDQRRAATQASPIEIRSTGRLSLRVSAAAAISTPASAYHSAARRPAALVALSKASHDPNVQVVAKMVESALVAWSITRLLEANSAAAASAGALLPRSRRANR